MPDPVAPAAPAAPAPAAPAATAPTPAPASPAAPAAPAAPSAATLVGGGAPAAPAAPQTSPATWPDNWRTLAAGDNKDELARLERFTDPSALYKSYRELENERRSGKWKPAAPAANAPPEEIAAWRKDAGVPEAPKGYIEKLALPAGMVRGKDDQPILQSFADTAHAKNWSPEQYNDAVGWYYQQQDQLAQQRAEADKAFKVSSDDVLRKDWGADYRGNLNAIKSLFGGNEEVLNAVFGGRTADGKLLGDDPRVLNAFAKFARELNPMAAVLPNSGVEALRVGTARIAEIDKMMRENPAEYWRGPNAAKIQEEYRQLTEAQERMGTRAT